MQLRNPVPLCLAASLLTMRSEFSSKFDSILTAFENIWKSHYGLFRESHTGRDENLDNRGQCNHAPRGGKTTEDHSDHWGSCMA